jgi:hypothetical protein
MKAILEFTLPRLRSFYIEKYCLQDTQSSLFKLKTLLNQCSIQLESLEVKISVQHADEVVDMEDKATEDESICWTSLKDLTLRHTIDSWDAGSLWSWMWKRCGQVEILHVHSINKSTPSLVQAMLAYMHNLQQIVIGDCIVWDDQEGEVEDDAVTALLSGSRHGWKSVSVLATARFGQKTVDALALHYSTLEQLHVHGNSNLPSCDLVQVLRSCPHLHTLSYISMYNGRTVVDGMAFVDLDPDTGLPQAMAMRRISQGARSQDRRYPKTGFGKESCR